jgi:hypothetical protein
MEATKYFNVKSEFNIKLLQKIEALQTKLVNLKVLISK